MSNKTIKTMDALVKACRGVKTQREFLPCRVSLDDFEAIDSVNAEYLTARLDMFGRVGKQTGKPSPISKTEVEAMDSEFI